MSKYYIDDDNATLNAADFADWLVDQGFECIKKNTFENQEPITYYEIFGELRGGFQLVQDFIKDNGGADVSFGIAADKTANADFYYVGENMTNEEAEEQLNQVFDDGIDEVTDLANRFAFEIVIQ